MKTITGREIDVKPNYTDRTFTIRCKDKIPVKYRTIPMTLHEFKDNLHNTANDWNWFLKNTDDYYKI